MAKVSSDNRLRIQELSSLIGNTPLLAIEFLHRKERRVIYAKAENLNMTGSIKDRMAFHILQRGYERGTLVPNGLNELNPKTERGKK